MPGELVLAVGIDHGDGGRQRLSGLVMVRDDHFEPGLGGGLQRPDSRRAAIDRDDEARALCLQLQERRRIRAITFFLAVRDIGEKLATDSLKEARQQRGGRCAIDIIIAEYGNRFTVRDCAGDAVGRLVHIEEDRGIRQGVAQAGTEIGFRLVDIDAARRQHAPDDIGEPQPLGHGERQPVVGKSRAPGPAGEGLANAEKGRVRLRGGTGSDFRHPGHISPQLLRD